MDPPIPEFDEEAELADLFEDVLRISGSAENAKSSLRAYLHKLAHTRPPHTQSQGSGGLRPPVRGSSPSVSTTSISSVTSTSSASSMVSRPIPQLAHVLRPSFNTVNDPPAAPYPGDSIRLANPVLEDIAFSDSMHSREAFDYIRLMISQDPFYLGESELCHYRVRNEGFVPAEIKIPTLPIKTAPEGFYAVAIGHKIGIFLTWSDALPHVAGCPNNLHKKLSTYADAIVWMQVGLIKGVLELVPR